MTTAYFVDVEEVWVSLHEENVNRHIFYTMFSFVLTG